MSSLSRLRDSLIFVDDARAAGVDPRDLQPACRRGQLIRIRRGVYVANQSWDLLDARGWHLLAILSVVTQSRAPFLVAGRSAGAVWNLPFAAEWPDDVTLLVPGSSGGKSEPGVRRTVVAAGAARQEWKGGVPVTSLARTALDMARVEDFPRAVAIVDRALWSGNPDATTVEALREEWDRAGYVRRAAHLRRVIEFASPLADSTYESITRARIAESGFVAPVLQAELRDEEGVMRPDFLWPGIAAAEFDGKVKYTRARYTEGDPSGVVWREKRREDRLRRIVPTVVRIVADDLAVPGRITTLLRAAGVPFERPGRVASAPGGTGALAPVLEQWPR